MIELILVRHGETDSNVKGTYLGWTDVDLNEKGRFQAEAARDKLKGTRIERIYSSSLKRAIHTAQTINENFGIEVCLSDSLRERNFGAWDDLTYAQIVEKYPQEHDLWIKNMDTHCISGGESSQQAFNRVTGFVDELLKTQKEGTFLIVTHLGCVRKIISHLLGLGIQGAWRFRVDNAGICRIQINDEGYAYLTALNV